MTVCLLYTSMQALEEAQAPDSDGGKTITEEEQAYADSVNKVAAAFPTSSVRNTTDEVMAEIHCNFGTNFGFYDEEMCIRDRVIPHGRPPLCIKKGTAAPLAAAPALFSRVDTPIS